MNYICKVKVTGYSSRGEGVARLPDGRVVFINGAARADLLEIKLTEKRNRSVRGEILRILEPSPYRIEPVCPHYYICGGCDFRHITYEEEKRAKLQRVNDAMQRIGKLSLQASHVLSTGQIDGYRNKAVLHSNADAADAIGFYARQSHKIININRCLLLKDDLNAALLSLTTRLPNNISDHSSCDFTLRTGRNGLEPPLEEELDGLIFDVSGFFQINTGAAMLLCQEARKFASIKPNETLFDLYCGVGLLTLFVGRDARYALGVEINPGAVDAARRNALRNRLAHIEFMHSDAAKFHFDGASKEKQMLKTTNPDCVIVDPPRKGLSSEAVRSIINLSPKRIVYISCDPASLARDIRMISGYAAKDISIIDMFPRTANVECCCLLSATPP